MDRAACAETSVEEFFVEAGRVIEPVVLSMCRSCPVRRECLEYAYHRDFSAGYFGGFSPGERKKFPVTELLDRISNGL